MSISQFINGIIELAIFCVIAYAIFCFALACIRSGILQPQADSREPELHQLIARGLILKGAFGKNLQKKLRDQEAEKKGVKLGQTNYSTVEKCEIYQKKP